MAYNKTNFREGDILTANHMNNIENGIIAIEDVLDDKQDKLYNGVNLKTINGISLLGPGNIDIQGTEGSDTAITVDDFLSSTSTNPVQNKVLKNILDEKQDKLTSGQTLKTINNQSLLGSGNISITGDGASIAVDTELSASSKNPVQNNVITLALGNKQDKLTVDSELSISSYNPIQNKTVTTALANKQDTLISGTSIKTINGQSLLDSGNIAIEVNAALVGTNLVLSILNGSAVSVDLSPLFSTRNFVYYEDSDGSGEVNKTDIDKVGTTLILNSVVAAKSGTTLILED